MKYVYGLDSHPPTNDIGDQTYVMVGVTDAGPPLSRGPSQQTGDWPASCAVTAKAPAASWHNICPIPATFNLPALPSYSTLRNPPLTHVSSEEITVAQPLQPQLMAEGTSSPGFPFPKYTAAHAGQMSTLTECQ